MNAMDDLWCEDCGKNHVGLCRKHGVVHKVEDAVIPSRARLTLPPSLTLKTVKENGNVATCVFAKKTIPVRSLFGPLHAPVISRSQQSVKQPKATTVWKKKHAMQKALETSNISNNGAADNHEHLQPGIDNGSMLKFQSPMPNKATPAEVAISSIQQQLMSITSSNVSQTAADSQFIGIQPMYSTPVNTNQSHQLAYQQNLQDLPAISIQTSHGSFQLSHEHLQQLQQHYQSMGLQELAGVQQSLNIHDAQIGVLEQPGTVLNQLGQPLVEDRPGVVETSQHNISDSTDVTSDTELDDSQEQDMAFELKILTDDGFIEVLDCKDEEHSNWMIFVRQAHTLNEQNLIAYQEDGCIFFASMRAIPANTELKVWYSKEYGKALGKGSLSLNSSLKQVDGKLQCIICENYFQDEDEMKEHLCGSKLKARRKGRPRKYVKPTKTWRAKLEKSKIKESNRDSNKSDSKNVNQSEVVSSPMKRTRGRPKLKVEEDFITYGMPDMKTEVQNAVAIQTDNELDGKFSDQVETLIAEVKDPGFNEGLHIDDNDDEEDETDPLYAHMEGEKVKKKRGPRFCRDPFICPHCNEKFVAEANYHLHVFEHTGVKPFVCHHDDCYRGFLSKFKLQRHMLIHTSPREHKCSYCDKSFNRKDHLKNHMITHDPNKKMFRCEKCDKEYCYSFSYRIHMAFHKAEDGELKCSICKKEFETKDQLLFHLKIHTGARAAKNSSEKTHPCLECGKKFFTRKDVKRHMVTHTKRKDFLCQYCPQSFGRKDHLTRHLKTSHTGDNSGKARRGTGEEEDASPTKTKDGQLYATPTSSEATNLVPYPVAIHAVPQEEFTDQLIQNVTDSSADQNSNISQTQTAFLQNLQYAMGRENIQLTGTIYEATIPPTSQDQPQQQTEVTQIQNLQHIQSNVPVQFQINDKGYIMSSQQPEQQQQQQQQTMVRQIQLSPNIDYKQLTSQLQQGNMFIQAGNSMSQQPTQNQDQQQTQVQTIQQIPIPIQQQQIQQNAVAQAILSKLEPVANNANNNITILQPPEYQQSTQSVGILQAVSSVDNTRPSIVLANATADGKQNPHSQTYSTLLGYVETLRFLENLPTNNSTSLPIQQLQAVNIEVTQAPTPHILPSGTYNIAASGTNIVNINQADLAKGVVAISNPHVGTLQLTPQDFKNVVSLAHGSAPVQQITYQ